MDDSSVAFNLAELLQLQAQREVEERGRAAARGAAEHAERLERERLERERLEREQQARRAARLAAQVDAERERRELEAQLLRVRLELEAAERADRARAEREHVERLARLRRPERSLRVALAGNAVLGLLVAGSVATYLEVLAPELESSHALAQHASALVEQKAHELEHLRARAAELEAAQTRAASSSVTSAGASAEPAQPAARVEDRSPSPSAPSPSRVRERVRTRGGSTEDALCDLDLTSDDPLAGALTAGCARAR